MKIEAAFNVKTIKAVHSAETYFPLKRSAKAGPVKGSINIPELLSFCLREHCTLFCSSETRQLGEKETTLNCIEFCRSLNCLQENLWVCSLIVDCAMAWKHFHCELTVKLENFVL